MAIDALGAEA